MKPNPDDGPDASRAETGTHVLEYYDDLPYDQSRWAWRYRELFVDDNGGVCCDDPDTGQFLSREEFCATPTGRIYTNAPGVIAAALGFEPNDPAFVFYWNPKQLLIKYWDFMETHA